MPHAVLLGATLAPTFPTGPFARHDARIHRVLEIAESGAGWLLKCVIIEQGATTKLLARIDRRDDGLVVRLDDHMHVERTPAVFEHLGEIARLTLAANPGATVGPTNLQAWLAPKQSA